MEYTSNDNKGLLWGILQESNIFDGINNNDFDKIKHIFENTIYNVSLNNQNESLIDKNKVTIEEMIRKINKEKEGRNEYREHKLSESSKIKVVYKAEDLKQERLSEFNAKLQKYQDENGTLGKINKPDEISFIDKNDMEDKPIGDEMDRLISERLANRERELELLPVSNDAENWINNGRDSSPATKKVSFQEETTQVNNTSETTQVNNTSETRQVNNTSETTQVNNILNILKRKSHITIPNKDDTNPEQSIVSISNDNEVEQNIVLKEIVFLKNQQVQILEMCSKIITILQDNKNNN